MYKYTHTHIHIYVNICFVIEYVTEKSKQTFWPTLYIIYYINININTHTHIYSLYVTLKGIQMSILIHLNKD